MALTELIGTDLGEQTVTIERGPVRVFAQSLGYDPADFSEEGASTPPTWPFVMAYWGTTDPASGLPLDRLRGPGRMILHGEQEFDYMRMPAVGETLVGRARISDVYERDTSSATMEFYVRETEWRDRNDQPVVTERFVLIIRAAKPRD